MQRLMERLNLGEEEACEFIAKSDKKRAAYYGYYSYRTWGAASTYHLCIDSSLLDMEGTVDFIEAFVRKRFTKE